MTQILQKLDSKQRQLFLSSLMELPPDMLALTRGRLEWLNTARPNQLPPNADWLLWLLFAGRGFGKTRTGSQFISWEACTHPGTPAAIIGATLTDVRRYCFEGPSGLLKTIPEPFIKSWNKSSVELVLTNGSTAFGYSGEEPDRLRGPQHELAWCDELASWAYPDDTWNNLIFGMRVGKPRIVVTSTPQPIDMIIKLRDRVGKDAWLSTGSTFENAANLAPEILAEFRERYEGTRLGRQELYAEILTDIPGALWTWDMIEEARRRAGSATASHMRRIVVAIDPAVTNDPESSSETGIVVAGIDKENNFCVLQDASMRGSPNEWATRAIALYKEWKADRIIGEVNNGGDLIENTLRAIDRNVSFTAVRATRGKYVRAEPVSAIYERHRAKHYGSFPELEKQMTHYTPTMPKSPDRFDALVWAGHELVVRQMEIQVF